MSFSRSDERRKIVVDSVHGDIELSDEQWRVVDTASFQRLRFIKQLGMGHLVYPNATHTRFAHSLGVFGIMRRILETALRNNVKDLTKKRASDLQMAALLHDVGHYPYSHLLEGVDKVQLFEEFVHDRSGAKRTLGSRPPYPNHVRLGRIVVTHQKDLLDAIGGKARAKRIADLFGRSVAADPQWSKLISSSFDMDRLDYLLRDSQAAGVPYGAIDLNYLLNAISVSPNGMLGVSHKALPAAEQYLMARYFMHRTVYYHKTTYGFEETARQLVRRIRDSNPDGYDLPADGLAVEEIFKSRGLHTFVDGYLDALFQEASHDSDETIQMMARSLLARRPPKLVREVAALEKSDRAAVTAAVLFKQECRNRLKQLAEDTSILPTRFMFCEIPALRLEKRGATLSADEARDLPPEEAEELIKVFEPEQPEPHSLVDIEHSVIHQIAGYALRIARLYVIDDGETDESVYEKLRDTVKSWEQDWRSTDPRRAPHRE